MRCEHLDEAEKPPLSSIFHPSHSPTPRAPRPFSLSDSHLGRIATSGGADLLASAIRYGQSLTPSVPNSVWSQAVSLFHSTYPELIRIQSLSGGTGLTSGSPTEDARIRNALDGVIESNKRGMSESGWEVREGQTEERSFLRFAEEQMVLERQEELARKEFWSRMQSGLDSNPVPQFGSGSGSCSGSGSEFGRASGIGSGFGRIGLA